jgi:two-component system NtrC family sensor kinase
MRGIPDDFAEYLHQPIRLDPESGLGRVRQGERVAVSLDLAAEEPYRAGNPQRRAFVDLGRARSAVRVPLIKNSRLLGIFTVYRQEVSPFTDKQIALLQNFAAQAVIAIENSRLLGELRQRTGDLQEALEYQTATSDVLKVISRSTFDLQPVLDTLAETAARLCESGYSAIFRRDGEVYRIAAVVAFSPETMDAARKFQTFLEQHPLVPGRGSITGRVALEGRAVHVADTASDPEYTLSEATTLGNLRTQLGVPLLRQGEPIGVIVVARQRVEPFTNRQVELVHTFADQAVIAMENARLITETREALEQQTATAEVLRVINSSPGDLAPVFDAMLEKAMRLCAAAVAYAEFRSNNPPAYGSGTAPARILAGERVVHIADMTEEDAYRSGDPNRRAIVDLGGARTSLLVALVKDDAVLGFIMIYRQEVRPFSDKQIALLQNFAAQAVIAMENARLITETQEALEQQTATAEVLQVINSSPGDLAPVFDATLESATTLCESAHGALFIRDGDSNNFRAIPSRSTPRAFAEFLTCDPIYFDPERSILAQTLQRRSAIQIADMRLSEPYQHKFPLALAAVESGGTRTLLSVPLVRDDAPVGIFQLARQEVRPFSDKQIALVSNFAAQA